MKPHYRVNLSGQPRSYFEEIHMANNYLIDNGFVTFYSQIPGHKERIYVASYSTNEVTKIIFYTELEGQELREEKLKRLLKKPNIFKRIYNKFF